mgnify:CR=1 FL=1
MIALAAIHGGFPDDPRKRDPLDFILWQPSQADEPACVVTDLHVVPGGEGELSKCPDDRADAVVGERRSEAGLERARPFGESVECRRYSGLEQVGEQR